MLRPFNFSKGGRPAYAFQSFSLTSALHISSPIMAKVRGSLCFFGRPQGRVHLSRRALAKVKRAWQLRNTVPGNRARNRPEVSSNIRFVHAEPSRQHSMVRKTIVIKAQTLKTRNGLRRNPQVIFAKDSFASWTWRMSCAAKLQILDFTPT